MVLAASSSFGAAPTTADSQIYPGDELRSVSDNGEWVAGGVGVFTVLIRNLATGQEWIYDDFDPVSSLGTQYTVGLGRSVSNDGIVVGEVDDMPAYWENGDWNMLSTKVGGVTYRGSMQVGSITPDGSTIVGAIGNTGGELDDVVFTLPCLWQRNADGKGYGDPVMLPHPARDITNAIPQYFTALSVSDDGKTIGALMTCNYGFPHVPYAYTLNDAGEWEYTMLGADLINPDNIEFPKYAGEYNGPGRPNWELYLTPEQVDAYFKAFPEWADEKEAEGYTPEDIEILSLEFVANFMTGENKEKYMVELSNYLDSYLSWLEEYAEYEQKLGQLVAKGMDFVFNNMCISPDGKYIYSTGSNLELVRPDDPENAFDQHYRPVGFEVGTGNHILFSDKDNVLLSSVTSDYSVLGRRYNNEGILDVFAYIFPESNTESVDLLTFFRENGKTEAVDWIEENMYHDMLTATASGEIVTVEGYSMGIPVASSDMSVIVFVTSSELWVPEDPFGMYSYVLYTDMAVSGIEEVAPDATLPQGAPVYYNLQGVRIDNPTGGIYVKVQDGKASKVVL